MWFEGPTFVYDDSISSGEKCDFSSPTAECLAERKRSAKLASAPGQAYLFDISKYSSYAKVLRITMCVLRFIELKVKSFGHKVNSQDGTMWPAVILYRVQKEQAVFFPEDVRKCKQGKYAIYSEGVSTSLGRSLRIFKDYRGFFHCALRVQEEFPVFQVSNAFLLPKYIWFTRLLINYMQRILCHAGKREVLAHVRKEFWIPQGRSKVRSVINKCLTSKR